MSDDANDEAAKDSPENVLKNKLTRRQAIGKGAAVGVGVVAAGVVAGLGGFYAGQSGAPAQTVTATKTATATQTATATKTATATQTATATSTVQAPAIGSSGRPIKVGLLMTASPQTSFWDDAANNGLLQAAQYYNIQFKTVTNVFNVSDEPAALTSLANQGMDIVIDDDTVGGPPTNQVAKNFPNIWFGSPYNFDKLQPNQFSYTPDQLQEAYLGGIVAAGVSKAGKIGAPQGFLFPAIWANINAFKLGALSVNPNVQVFVNSINSWTDKVAGQQAGNALLDQGVDFFWVGTSQSEIAALGVAMQKNLPSVIDEAEVVNSLYTGNLGTGVRSTTAAIVYVLSQFAKNGTLQSTNYQGGVKEGWDDFAFQLNNINSIPQQIINKVLTVKQSMAAGSFEPAYVPVQTPSNWDGKTTTTTTTTST